MHKYLILILLFLSLGLTTGCNNSGIHRTTASSSAYSSRPGIFKDAFKRKTRRRSNVNTTTRRPFFAWLFGNKRKLYKFKISKKEKRSRKGFFKRRRLKGLIKKTSGDSFSRNRGKSTGSGRKGNKKGGLFKKD